MPRILYTQTNLTVSQGGFMNALYNLTIERRKLVIEPLREINKHDLVAVRETLNSIDFIMGDTDQWEYKQGLNEWVGTTKVRLHASEQILKFIEDNKDKLVMDSIDRTFLTDLTQVYKITRHGKSEKDIKSMNLDEIVTGNKKRITKKLNEAVENINELAETMGEIL